MLGVTGVAMPELAPIDITPGLELDQVPPLVASVKVEVAHMVNDVVPVIGAGFGLNVNGATAEPDPVV
jgi:hypothetical protein